jgi:hypothetical protein
MQFPSKEISVEKEGTVYAFGSTRGNHYWYVKSPSPDKRSSYMVGHILPYCKFGELYNLAFKSGYTLSDFEALKTTDPTYVSLSRGSTKSVMVSRKSTAVREPKVTTPKVVKSKLQGSMKLFA